MKGQATGRVSKGKDVRAVSFSHYSVLLRECIEGLHIRPNGVYIDGTAGGGGHSAGIAACLTTGTLLALDRDPDAVEAASERLVDFPQARVIRANFADMAAVLHREGFERADGVLLDLGVSSHQLDTAERGFSYQTDAPLDMRMSREGRSAAEIVANYPASELQRIFRVYGEERYAKQIASNIVRTRQNTPIETTGQLAELIKSSIPAAARREKNPCKRVFQAIRIEVNGELDCLREGMLKAFELLAPGGRLVVITFHSLEDRMVKHQFREWCTGCTCPPDFPVCVCNKKPRAALCGKQPILPSLEELAENKRSQSAKLRIIEKLPEELIAP